MTTPEQHRDTLLELCEAITRISGKGLTPATGGNFSVRISEAEFFITCSGVDKESLTPEHFLLCRVPDGGQSIASSQRPSAETLVHAALYSQDSSITSVFHTHSVPATILSHTEADSIRLQGYEMQKSIRGFLSHEDTLEIPLLANTQDMNSVNKVLTSSWQRFSQTPGFILKRHGLYAWGNSIFEAKRHTEGFEFLLQCELHTAGEIPLMTREA